MSGIQMAHDFCNYVIKSGAGDWVIVCAVVIVQVCAFVVLTGAFRILYYRPDQLLDSEANEQALLFAFWVHISYSFLGWFTGLW